MVWNPNSTHLKLGEIAGFQQQQQKGGGSNLSLITSVPEHWKAAYVSIIFTKEFTWTPGNYRPNNC